MHAFIVGPPGVGKSTLIRRVLDELDLPVRGFETKKGQPSADGRGCPVYIHIIGEERRESEENLLGYCENKCLEVRKDTFDRYAANLRAPVPEGCAVMLDELGTMESVSEDFRTAVLALLDGDAPVIAAVKHKDTPFLTAVRSHPRGQCFFITENNRDTLAEEVLAILRNQL